MHLYNRIIFSILSLFVGVSRLRESHSLFVEIFGIILSTKDSLRCHFFFRRRYQGLPSGLLGWSRGRTYLEDSILATKVEKLLGALVIEFSDT
jgi:hypothetical protein